MHHLIIIAIALFTNGSTGEDHAAYAVVPTVQACADIINEHRVPIETETGTWYMTQAACRVQEQ